MPKLAEEDFKATMGSPMQPVDADAVPPFDFWAYFDDIPKADFEGHDCSIGEVDHAWLDPTASWEHVLVRSTTPNVFMTLVLDLHGASVLGHHLLDLNRHYGVGTEPSH